MRSAGPSVCARSTQNVVEFMARSRARNDPLPEPSSTAVFSTLIAQAPVHAGPAGLQVSHSRPGDPRVCRTASSTIWSGNDMPGPARARNQTGGRRGGRVAAGRVFTAHHQVSGGSADPARTGDQAPHARLCGPLCRDVHAAARRGTARGRGPRIQVQALRLKLGGVTEITRASTGLSPFVSLLDTGRSRATARLLHRRRRYRTARQGPPPKFARE